MEKKLYDEMIENIDKADAELNLACRRIFLFGHCNATLELADLLGSRGLKVTAILDNSNEKQGLVYKGTPVIIPEKIAEMIGDDLKEEAVVLITSRFYSSMHQQLRDIGYTGIIRKVVDYNSYADYSLSKDTVDRMKQRERHGQELLCELKKKYDRHFRVFCPFNALGDIYFMMSYWPAFASKRNVKEAVFCVADAVLADVIHMFDDHPVEVYEQKDLDSMIQSVICTKDENSFIAHQDRPYVINLSKALYLKRIPLEKIYCCGVYGLPADTVPAKPRSGMHIFGDIESIPKGRAIIFSPYAKSVTAIDPMVWTDAVKYFTAAGYKCYTNVVGNEKPIRGTEAISPSLMEMRSVVERAGTFIGIRSGLCDILREARAKKTAIYPDYNYCDTGWKALDIYYIDQFQYNLPATEVIEWEKL